MRVQIGFQFPAHSLNMATLHRGTMCRLNLLRRLLVSIIADGAVVATITNVAGAAAITIVRFDIWFSMWTGFRGPCRPQLYAFIPLGLQAGAAGGAAKALIFSLVTHHPAATWLQRSVRTLATYLAALAIGRCCGAPSDCPSADAFKCAYMALVGHIMVGRFRWSLQALDLFNLRVSTACSLDCTGLRATASATSGFLLSISVTLSVLPALLTSAPRCAAADFRDGERIGGES